MRCRWRHWLVLLIAGTVALLGANHAAASTLKLDSAELVLDDSALPPSDSAPWQPQALPDNWNVSRPGQGGIAWYRLRFELPRAPDQLYAIYVRKLSMNAAFHANGALLGSGGQFEEPVARQWNRPQFFTMPPALLNEGENVLHVQAVGLSEFARWLGRDRARSRSRAAAGTMSAAISSRPSFPSSAISSLPPWACSPSRCG